ncbi:DMT family transporter [Raoultibacter phocaeensis]|uniref:DMT family transporter n=1 Tax=Raoultibacter phocaeensis TaxID=2479841 RepID=UPI00111A2011|nr:DMT family transporter [Raoultibacter phocaeensis]
MKSTRWTYVWCVVAQTVIFGFGNAVTKLAYDSITPFWCLALRFGLALVVFGLFFGRRVVAQLRTAKLVDWLPAALCMAASYISCNVALALTSATNVGFLVALPIVFTPIVAALVLKRPYRIVHLPFQALAVFGLYLLCCNGGAFAFGWGEVLALVAAASLAGALVFGERGLKNLDVATVSATQIGVTFVLSVAGALVFEPVVDVAAVQPTAWAVIAFLALLSTCVTFALQNAALTRLSSTMVSMLLCGEPLFTAAFSWIVLGEVLTGIGFAGAALIVVCVLVETYLDGRPPRRAQTLSPSASSPSALARAARAEDGGY